jgi:hypothetical protein
MNGTIIKPQMFYYCPLTKQRKSSNAIPDAGIYVHNTGKVGYVEVKFMA